MKMQFVIVNWESEESIEQAEEEKFQLECDGYTLQKTETIGLAKNRMTYVLNEENE
jgi:hypothetical protein